MDNKMSAEQRKWMAQDDARVLMSAEGIKSDARRVKAAAVEARRIADEAEKVASQRKTQAAAIQRKPAPPAKPQPKAQAKPMAAKRGK